MAAQLLVPIGLAWSPDARWFYLCDAPRREIYRYAFDARHGTIGERRVFARVPEGSGRPTGLAVDVEGGLWNTQTDGWCVVRYDPDGGIDRVIALPVPKPIDCCFGGSGLRTLFITTGRLGLPERRVAEVPWSGSVLAVDAPYAGLPATAY
jgi:sugar lactone lactonase YvrE